MSRATTRPAVAFYLGGFEAIGGIEACFQDIAVGLAGQPLDLSLFDMTCFLNNGAIQVSAVN